MKPILPDFSQLNLAKATRDELVALDEATGNFLECTCGCAIAKAGEGERLPFEESMAELLLSGWASASRGAVEVAIKRLAAQDGEITEKQISRVLALMGQQIDKKFVVPAARKLPEIFLGSYKLAKRGIYSSRTIRAKFDKFDDVAVEWLNDHHMYWIGKYYDRHLSADIAKVIREGIDEGLGRELIGDKLRDFFDGYPGVPSKPDHYWRGLAANGVNRSRQFGEVAAYEELAVPYLRIVAVRDERTSPICRNLDGQLIPSQAAIKQRNRLMLAASPDDVKEIAPWLKAEQVEDRSSEELVNMGIGMPPYHWYCRTTVVGVSAQAARSAA